MKFIEVTALNRSSALLTKTLINVDYIVNVLQPTSEQVEMGRKCSEGRHTPGCAITQGDGALLVLDTYEQVRDLLMHAGAEVSR